MLISVFYVVKPGQLLASEIVYLVASKMTESVVSERIQTLENDGVISVISLGGKANVKLMY